MTVDNLAGTGGHSASRRSVRLNATKRPPRVHLSATPDTLGEPTTSPHSHSPYYRFLLLKT
jgi:hypothetical protein